MERQRLRLDQLHAHWSAPSGHIVIAHHDGEYAAELHERFAERGYAVHLARSGDQARFLARRFRAATAVLDSEMPFESGWLTADKMRRDNPSVTIILVTPVPTFEDRQLAEFIHASAVVDRLDGPEAVAAQLDELEWADCVGRS